MGELRRLTIMFCDLVGSTALSARHEPELYRQIVRHYKETCQQIVEGRYDGHIAKVKGDGLLVTFGHPVAHEDDVSRAVRAGLDVVAAVRRLSEQTERDIGESLLARVGVHRGLVYLDRDEDDLYGLAANVAARLQELAPPGSLVISEDVLRLVGDRFTTRAQPPQKVKGVDEPLGSWQVLGERPGAASPAVEWPARLIGRAAELRRLRRAWGARPGAVVVRGDAGIGKSRLVSALEAEVLDEGARVVELTGSPLHAGAGFHPLRTLAESRCGIGRDVGGRQRLRLLRRHLHRAGLDPDELAPLLGPVLGIEPEAGYVPAATDARQLHEDITEAMWRYLRSLVGEGSALLVADDVQWFDQSTRDLVLRLLRSRQDGLLVVMIARDTSWSAGFGVDVVDLEPLSESDSLTLVAALDPAGATVADRAWLVARADGVPLYLEELVRAELGRSSDDEPPLSGRRQETPVPDVLYEPLVARLQATVGGVEIAAAAATIGRDVDHGLLAQVADVKEQELEAGLAALLDGMILVSSAGAGAQYRFRHELLREVAYELQPPSVRRIMHGRVADALASAVGDAGTADWLALAEHYEEAGRPVEAVDCYGRAAEEARRRGALSEARADLTRALDLMWALPEGRQRNEREVRLRLQRGFLAVSSEGYASPEAGADYETCLELATRDRSLDDMFTTLISLWSYYTSRAQLARAREVLTLLRTVLTGGREWLLPENEAGFGMLDWFGGRFPDALEHLERAAAAARSRGSDERMGAVWFLPNDPLAAIHAHLALARFVAGDPSGASDALATAQRVAAEQPFPQGPFSAAYSRSFGAWIELHLGAFDDAEMLVESTLALAEAHGFDFWRLTATTQRAMIGMLRACRSEPVDRAVVESHVAMLGGLIATWRMLDTPLFLPTVMTTLGAGLAAMGDRTGASERLAESLALAAATGVHFYDAETHRISARLTDDPDAAARCLRTALELARDQGAIAFQLRIARDLYVLAGDRDRPSLVEALDQFTPGASYPELDAARALLAGG